MEFKLWTAFVQRHFLCIVRCWWYYSTTFSVRPDRVGYRLKYLKSHNLSKCMKFYFILMTRQWHSVLIGCFSHKLVNACSEMNNASPAMKCKISQLLTSPINKSHHHLCIDLLYVLYIHKCILCILDHALCMCYDFKTQPFGYSESSSLGFQDVKPLFKSVFWRVSYLLLM